MTTVVAWLALLVSVASLGWQVHVWKKTVGHVLVDLKQGTYVTYYLHEEEPYVVVTATNVGRVAATINEVRVHFYEPTGLDIGAQWEDSEVKSSSLPKKLEPGEEFVKRFDASSLLFWSPDVHSPDRRLVRSEVVVRAYVRVGREILAAPHSLNVSHPAANS